MSCEYCDDWNTKPLVHQNESLSRKGDFYPGINLEIDGSTLLVSAVPDTYEPGYLEAEVKINYCPMCGEKLREE